MKQLEHPLNPGMVIPTMMLVLRSCHSSYPKQHMWVPNTLTQQWCKAVVKSKAETPRSYVVSTPDGDKRRKRIHLKDAGIPKVVHNAQPNPKGSVPRKPSLVLVALKPPGGNGLPKYVLRSVPNPSINSAVGKSIPYTRVNKAVGSQSPNQSVNSDVQNSVIQNGVNSAQDQNVQNNAVNTNQEQKGNEISKANSIQIVNSVPSSCNVPKLELKRKSRKN